MRKQIAAANWKMNGTLESGQELLKAILAENIEMGGNRQTVFAVPYPFLIPAASSLGSKTGYSIAAQNCYQKKSGAFTGEVSVDMLRSIGISWCVIGHSERREYFSETNAQLAEKVSLCLETGITPVFCCGEPLPIREEALQNAYVQKQLEDSLFHLSAGALKQTVIAYEPIWAIGTGKTASSAQAQEMHAHIRSVLAGKYGADTAAEISILYGGSVKGSNAAELFSQPDVDGGLVGGASLVAAEFCTIMKSLK